MRPLLSFSIYLGVVLIGGALVAPLLFHAVQSWALSSSFWRELAEHPFSRFVARAMLGLALLGLYPFLRSIGIRHWRDVGLVKPAGQASRFWSGFALGFITLAVIATGQLTAGARTLEINAGLLSILGVAGGALVVALTEELLFRGALFGALRQTYHWVFALLVSSAFYALVHFFQRPPRPPEVVWSTGFVTLGQMLRGFTDWHALVPGFFCLTLAGAILGLGYHRTGTLYFPMGLHAGWVFWTRLYGELTNGKTKMTDPFWGSRKLIDGWGAMLLLSFFLLLMILWRAPRPVKHAATSKDGEMLA